MNEMDDFYERLNELSSTASSYKHEGEITKILKNNLETLVDFTNVDEIGNLHAFRQGHKPGLIMFSAHQDKVMRSNIVGGIFPNVGSSVVDIVFDSETIFDIAIKENLFIYEKGYKKIEFDWEKSNPTKVEKEIVLENVCLNNPDLKIDFYSPLFCLLSLKERNSLVKGKFDDSLGMVLISDIIKRTKREDTPSILGLFTVGEESGFHGSQYFVGKKFAEKYPLSKIIVLDTTRAIKLGEGIVLYKNCGGRTSHRYEDYLSYFENLEDWEYRRFQYVLPKIKKEPLVEEIEQFAKERGFKLTTKNAALNDSAVFAETGIPTVALEVPIESMHSAIETCSKEDIELMRAFLKQYLER